MAVFADAEEVYRYLAGIFRRGLENEDLANRLAGSGWCYGSTTPIRTR